METLHIASLEARYHLSRRRMDHGGRLDRLLERVMDEALEPALARLGVPLHEEILIRDVHVPVRLRLGAGDEALVLQWSLALAEAVRRTLDEGGDGVVRYGSRHQALVDFACGVARGDLRRAWAWRRLGLWSAAEGAAAAPAAAARWLAEALAREPQAIVAVLAAVASVSLLGQIATHFASAWWLQLAQEALRAGGGPSVGMPSIGTPSTETLTATTPAAGGPADARIVDAPAAMDPSAELAEGSRLVAQRRLARRIVAASALAGAFVRQMARRDAPSTRPAFAVLALLEVEPGLARRGREEVRELMRAVAAELAVADETSIRRGAGRRASTGADGRRDAGRAEPARAASGERPPEVSDPGSAATASLEIPASPDAAPRETPPLPARVEGFTDHGGLLFLVGVADDLDLPDEIAADPALGRRSLRWVLHQLALALQPIAADDAAALAFAGLPPDSRPPAADEPPIERVESAACEALRQRIVADLRQRLDLGAEEKPTSALLRWLCRRRARMVADPGWIEIRLALDDVSTDIRRAGLDLDPGHVPWLGVVMRFIYE